MEVWFLSQSGKSLVCSKDLSIFKGKVDTGKEFYGIWAKDTADTQGKYEVLGYYDTEEQAKAILLDIGHQVDLLIQMPSAGGFASGKESI